MHSLPMHLVQWRSVLIFLYFTLALVTGKPGFLLTTHNTLIPGSNHKVCITFTGVTSDVIVHYEFKRPKDSSYSNIYAASEKLWTAVGGCSEFAIPLTLPSGLLELSVNGYSIGDERDRYEFNGSTILKVFKRVPDFTLIQTDKPVYKPGQTVRIRLVTLMFNLSVVTTGGVNVSIKNPDGIDIERWEGVSRSKGIVELSLQLANEPRLGTYAIVCDVSGRIERKNFTVMHYVLPRVEVLHEAAEYLVVGSPFLIGKVCARYTFFGGMKLPALKGLLTARFSVVKTGNESSVTGVNNAYFTATSEINECYTYNVSTEQFNIDWQSANIADSYSILVSVNVTEHGTGLKTRANDALIKLMSDIAVIQIIGEDTYKPGLPYSFKVKLMFVDGQSHEEKSISVSMFNGVSREALPEEITDGDGFVYFDTYPVSLFEELTIEAKYKDAKSRAQVVSKKKVTAWYSPSGRYIKIQPPNDGNALGCNKVETINFDYTTTNEGEAVRLNLQVIGKSNIVLSESLDTTFAPSESITTPPIQILAESCSTRANVSITTRQSRGSGSITLTTNPEMYPTAKVIVFYIASNGEIVADWTVIRMKECTRNSVTLSFSKKIVRPGRSLTLDISAAAESFCTYGSIDRSIDLISRSKLLDLAEVFETAQASIPVNDNWQSEVGDYLKYKGQCEQQFAARNHTLMNPLNVNDSRIAFLMGKMAVVTDVQVETRKCFCSFNAISLKGRVLNTALEPEIELASDGITYEPSVLIRDYFPETWLWDSVTLSRSGKASININSPHSLTSWRGKAMCVHRDLGFGISPVALLTTFQRFFIRVRLPYSVIRGESVPVVAKIHNYYSDCFTVSVFIESSNQFDIHEGTAARCICGTHPEILVFRIIPKSIGFINVTITAKDVELNAETNVCPPNATMSAIAGIRDTVVESLLVEPEGRREELVQSAYICGRAGEPQKNWPMDFTLPKGIVADSARGSISVVGDLLAVTVTNMKDLIILPQGCGEQSMGAFAPITFAARYLDVTGQLTPAIANDVREFLKTGYQKQLTRMNKDRGYFSYYYDHKPSLWLTAFIVKCFTHASQYLTVARDNIGLSMKYIRDNQSPDGCFSPSEAGVYVKFARALEGPDVEKQKIRVTAFVVIALLEAGEPANNFVIERAIHCLNNRDETDIYGLAMTAYAFSLHDLQSLHRRNAMNALLRQASLVGSDIFGTAGKTMHWMGDTSQNENAPINIETTAYALLAMLREPGKTLDALPIVNWLTRRQNSRGGYASTQDTVVSIQALASYAEATYSTVVHTGVVVRASTPDFSKSFEVTARNRLVVQSAELPNLRHTNLTFSIAGGGCVVVQAKAIYNVMFDRAPSTYFQTLVKPYYKEKIKNTDNCTQRLIQICTRYNGAQDNSSGMTIIDVKMISGWTPDVDSLNALKENTTLQLTLYELKNQILSLHFKEITREFRCLTFEAIRMHSVRNARPGQVLTYEYYAPGHRNETTFTFEECAEEDSPDNSTEVTPTCPDGSQDCPNRNDAICPSCSQPSAFSSLCRSKHVLKIRAANENSAGDATVILEDLKNRSSILKNRPATLAISQSCPCEAREEDNSMSFIVATTNDIAARRSRSIVIDLYGKENYIFTWTRDMERRVADALRRCSKRK